MRKLLALASVAVILAGCATFTDPSSDINDIQIALTTAEGGYAVLCASLPTLAVCTGPDLVKATQAEKLAQDAINAAKAAMSSGDPAANVAALIASAQKLEADFEAIFSTAKLQAHARLAAMQH